VNANGRGRTDSDLRRHAGGVMKRKGILYIVSAPSGAGKTTLCREALDIFPDLRHSVSFTTRPARTGEIHGRDYFFISPEEFQRMVAAGEFAEWAQVHGNYYGTSLKTLFDCRENGIDLILDIDCQGARQLKEKYRGGVFIFILPPSILELRRRLDGRDSDSPETIALRIENAGREIAESRWYDYLVVNDIFSKAVEEFRSIIMAERLRTGLVLETVSKEFDL
jgi:guanylate kinase